MNKSNTSEPSPADLVAKLKRLYGLVAIMDGGADWKSDIFSEIGEIWAKTGVPGADAVFERAVQELSSIEADHRTQDDNDNENDEGSDKTDLLIHLAEVWAQSNPKQAVNLLADIADPAKRSASLSQVAAAWVKIDPEQALKLARSIEHDADKEWALAYVARFWDKSAPLRAVQVAQMLESNVQKASVLCDVAAMCAKTDPNQAGAIFQQALEAAGQVAEDSIPSPKKSAFSRFLASLSSDRPSLTKAPLLKALAVAWAEIDPEQALNVAERITDNGYKDGALEKILPLLAREQPQQAVHAADEIQTLDTKAYTLIQIAAVLAKREPRQAGLIFDQALSMAKPFWFDGTTREVIARQTAFAGAKTNLERSLQTAQSISSLREKTLVLNDIAVEVLDTNPQQAVAIFQQSVESANAIRSGDDRAQVLRLSAEVWAEKIPHEALKVAEDIRNPFDKAAALNKIAAMLAKTDAGRAKAMLTRPLSDSELKAYERFYYDKTEAVRDIAAAIVKDDFAGADALFQNVLLLANRINDAARKATALGYLAEAWAATNPQQALQITDSIFYEEMKAETLSKVAVVWVQAVPKQAGQVMEVARRINKEYDRHKFQAIYKVANAWTKADFEDALAYASETDDLAEREAMINGILLALSQEAESLIRDLSVS